MSKTSDIIEGAAVAVAEASGNPLEMLVAAVVDKWYADRMHNTAVSRDTEVHNIIHAAKPALVAALVAELSKK